MLEFRLQLRNRFWREKKYIGFTFSKLLTQSARYNSMWPKQADLFAAVFKSLYDSDQEMYLGWSLAAGQRSRSNWQLQVVLLIDMPPTSIRPQAFQLNRVQSSAEIPAPRRPLIGGSIPGSSSLHIQVSLGNILNPRLLCECVTLQACFAASAVSVWMCVWMASCWHAVSAYKTNK